MTNSLITAFNPLTTKGSEASNEYVSELLRNEVNEIINSYHHKFDQLYECIQNAVDACESAYVNAKKHKVDYAPLVRVEIDLDHNRIEVTDNGLGMTKEEVLYYFFTPYATLKGASKNTRQRGEKGVGATFLSYGSNEIHLTTISAITGQLTSGILKGGLKWCKDDTLSADSMPHVDPFEAHSAISSESQGTTVSIVLDPKTNIGNLAEYGNDWKQWEAVLRLHTAIGYVDLSGDDPFLKALQAKLTVVIDKEKATRMMETGYLFPNLTTSADIQLSEITRTSGRLVATQKDKSVLWDTFSFEQIAEKVTNRMENIGYMREKKKEQFSQILNENKPEAYVCFTYGSDFWAERNHEIWGSEIEGQLSSGIVFATKSQKIGEQERVDFKYRTGDFNRFFILLNFQNIHADIGRKSLPEHFGHFANFFANSIQTNFVEDSDCLTPSPGAFAEEQEAALEATIDKALDREDLGFEWIQLKKLPLEEQDVIALFFNLLGNQRIRGYQIFSTHIAKTYDGVGKFHLGNEIENIYHAENNKLGIAADKFNKKGIKNSQNRCYIEFKFNSDQLVKDVRAGYKRMRDIKWLICWEIGKGHKKEGIDIIDITDPAHVNHREYYGVTHIMVEQESKIFIICLRRVLEVLSEK